MPRQLSQHSLLRSGIALFLLLSTFQSIAADPNWYAEGIRAERVGDYDRAIENYRRAASEGMSIAGFAIGRVYRDHLGNVSASFDAFLTAARQGNPFAQYEVGVYYLNGSGTGTRDLDKGKRWLELASVQGRLADASLRLFEIADTDEERRKWLVLAAEQGSVAAMETLAHSLETGAFGVLPDSDRSAAWKLAADSAREDEE